MTADPRQRPVPFDLFAPGVIANPYPWYRMLRERSPIHYAPDRGVWVLSRFPDVRTALLNHTAFSSADGIAYGRQSTRDLITSDPSDHTRMRTLVNRMFTPRAISSMEDRIRTIISGLLDDVQERIGADWVADVAVPLPITVIAEVLGDVADRADFKRCRWSNSILAVVSGDHSILRAGTRVILLFGSASRDSRHFTEGDTFRIARNPTSHVAFGAGIHACLGAALGRMELRALATEIDKHRLRVLPAGQNRRSDNTPTPLTRGMIAMPVAVI